MGLKLRGVLRCGACGKPRGLGTHLCSPGPPSPSPHPAAEPGHVGVPELPQAAWPAAHVRQPRSTSRSASASRRRPSGAASGRPPTAKRAARRKQAAAERRAREKARKQRRGSAGRARGKPQHDYATCTDKDCTRHPCLAYRQGIEDCPLPHGG